MYDDETYLSGTSSCSSEILVPRISQTFDTHSRLPPITSFETRDDLYRYCKDYAKTNGYMLSISNSVPSRNVILVCDRAGFQRRRVDRSEPQKRTTSIKTGCQFKIYGFKEEDKWTFKIPENCESHNHEITDLIGHPQFCQLKESDITTIRALSSSNVAPREILTTLRLSNSNSIVRQRQIYNARAKIKRENLAGRTPIIALLETLKQSNWKYEFKLNEDNKIVSLFFAKKESLSLAKKISNVLLLDCTYKTNKFGMPLMNIIGITSVNTSFFVGFVFLDSETIPYYSWALEKLKEILKNKSPNVFATDRDRLAIMRSLEIIYPESGNILCTWHINKNILAKCKRHFPKGSEAGFSGFMVDWQNIINSKTMEEYEENVIFMETKYGFNHPSVTYVKNTWLKHKEKIVSFWTDEFLHLGSQTTSRVEGHHGVLKKYLNISTGDLFTFWQKIDILLMNQLQEYSLTIAAQKVKIPSFCDKHIFNDIKGKISHFAMELINEEYELSLEPSLSEECVCEVTKIWGVPCAHIIKNLGKISIVHVTKQWHLFDYEEDQEQNEPFEQICLLVDDIRGLSMGCSFDQQRRAVNYLENAASELTFNNIKEPNIEVNKRGRPENSTRRELSAFEHVLNEENGATRKYS